MLFYHTADSGGTEIFGSPIGTRDHTQRYLHRKYTECTKLLSIISFMDANHAYPLLQACVNTKPMHLLFIHPPPQPDGFIIDFDYIIERTIAPIANSPTTQLKVHSQMLYALPAAFGGLGISATRCHKEICFLASTLNVYTFVRNRHPHLW